MAEEFPNSIGMEDKDLEIKGILFDSSSRYARTTPNQTGSSQNKDDLGFKMG
jgi:hypothetical protein